MKVKSESEVAQSCPTLSNPMDCSPPVSPVPGILGGSKITVEDDGSHEVKRCLLLGREVITNLDSIFKSRDITLPTKVPLVKAMVFPEVMYGCES